jgi:hypothetical protein
MVEQEEYDIDSVKILWWGRRRMKLKAVKFLWRRRMKLKTEELMVEKENDEVKD